MLAEVVLGNHHAQRHHLLRRHRQRDFREHFQCAEALSLPAQDGEDAAARTAGLADGGAAGRFPDFAKHCRSATWKIIADLRAGMPARQFVKSYRSSARSWNLAYAAPSPACAAAADRAPRAATASTHSAATHRAATAATATTATPANNIGELLHVAAIDFLIEEMERGEADVGHFLFAKNEALIGRDVVRLREISRGYRVRRCAPPQRKSQSGCTEYRGGGGFGCARVLRSLLHPWHWSRPSLL
jgi:hypothetical protein